MKDNRLRPMIISAVMGALALTLPIAFHAVGLGSKFLPMLLPLLLNGFLAPFSWAAGTGVLVPWISALATGMPPLYPPLAGVVSAEGAVMGGLASVLYRHAGGKMWLALVPAVVAGRIIAGALTGVLAGACALPPAISALAACSSFSV